MSDERRMVPGRITGWWSFDIYRSNAGLPSRRDRPTRCRPSLSFMPGVPASKPSALQHLPKALVRSRPNVRPAG